MPGAAFIAAPRRRSKQSGKNESCLVLCCLVLCGGEPCKCWRQRWHHRRATRDHIHSSKVRNWNPVLFLKGNLVHPRIYARAFSFAWYLRQRNGASPRIVPFATRHRRSNRVVFSSCGRATGIHRSVLAFKHHVMRRLGICSCCQMVAPLVTRNDWL